MATAVEALKTWFAGLSEEQKRDVVTFLYEGRGKMLVLKGVYAGPIPGVVTRGLFCGTVPAETTSRCPTCGKAY